MAEQKKQWVKLTNKGPGPRMILLPTEGKTIQKGASAVLQMTENDFKGIQPYISLGHIVPSEPTDEEIEATQPRNSRDIGGITPTNDVAETPVPVGDIVPNEPEVPNDEEEFHEDDGKPTHVEHRGFGRWYGFSGDDKLTQAMTEDEANAYAQEHGLQAPVTPNPSTEETPAEEPAPSADETETPAEETPSEETPAEEPVEEQQS